MAFRAAIADRPSPRSGWPRSALFAWAAIAASLLVAGLITGSDLPTFASAALPHNSDGTTFADRFLLSAKSADDPDLHPSRRLALAMADTGTSPAPERFVLRWIPRDLRTTITEEEEPQAVETRPVASAGIVPLPKSRPAAADQVLATSSSPTLALALADSAPQKTADRSFLQKLSDLMPSRLKLASLNTGMNLLGKGPDLAAFGYDESTAVYDITAHAVYLPNGTVLEAHSGIGSLRDDPGHVSVPNQGATPPAVYSLKPREKDFHGVAALRMTPTDGSDIGGRSGLLVHSFMLGPNGDSNGCISVRDYDRFLKAYNDGQFNRIAVVTSLRSVAETLLAAQNNPT